jgi:hypothetical protein
VQARVARFETGNLGDHKGIGAACRRGQGDVRARLPHLLLAAMDEDVPSQVVLGKVIRAMGVKECAANRLLKPFGLKLSLARIDGPRGRHAA